MSMTRKDYVALAAIFRNTRDWLNSTDEESSATGDAGGHHTLMSIEDDVADVLAADNPRFDRERFLAACRKSEVQS